jgi:hypothetical protein
MLATIYEHYRDFEMAGPAGERWQFAKRRITLVVSRVEAERDHTWNVFTLPGEVLRPLREEFGVEWHRRGRELFCEEGSPIEIPVIARVDETLFDPAFKEMLACRIAWEACETITQSNQKKADAKTQYAEARKQAARQNAFEIGSDPIEQNDYNFSWVSNRYM